MCKLETHIRSKFDCCIEDQFNSIAHKDMVLTITIKRLDTITNKLLSYKLELKVFEPNNDLMKF